MRSYRETLWTRSMASSLAGLKAVGRGLLILITLAVSALSGGDLPSDRKEWLGFLLMTLCFVVLAVGVRLVFFRG